MMQFSESPLPSLGLCLDLQSLSWPSKPSSSPSGGSSSMSTSSCMEQLLIHCALAVDRNDSTLAHQILWVLNTLAPPDGDSTQRLVSAFLRSLISRASRSASSSSFHHLITTTTSPSLHRFSSPLDLTSFLDLTPFHRFGYSASNAAIAEAVDNFPVIHIVDLSTTHCMQIPTLIDTLANRPEGPPYIKLTVPCPDSSIPPMLDFSYDEVGSRLVNFARSRNVAMEFRVVPSNPTDGFETLIDQLRMQRLVSDVSTEALIINCQMLLRYIPDETASLPLSMRSEFLKNVRFLHPNLVTVVDEDADLTARDVVGRLRAAYNYLWIQYDVAEALMGGKGSERRRWYEAEVGWKIENVVGCEGLGRLERGEGRGRWVQRMRGLGFRSVGFGEEAVAEVKGMLEEHAAGWGLKKEDEEGDLVMTWKGHNVVFATAWVPSHSSSPSSSTSPNSTTSNL